MGQQHARSIGPVGTVARVAVGIAFLAGGFAGQVRLSEVVFGFAALPLALLLWQWLRLRFNGQRLNATGPMGFAVNIGVFVALYLTPSYASTLSFTSDGALFFYGSSMLLAAVRGYGGCELLALSNWLLRRDDQVGCVLFSPIDAMEGNGHSRR